MLLGPCTTPGTAQPAEKPTYCSRVTLRRPRSLNFAGGCDRAGSELLAAVEQRATRLIGGLSPGSLHALLQGFAELAWEPGREFLAACEAAAVDAVKALTARELAELMHAFCRLGHQPGNALMIVVKLSQPS